MSKDRYQYHDYYLMDELLTDEHRLVQSSVRDWVKKEVSPIVEEACQKAEFPKQWIKGLAEIGAFGPWNHHAGIRAWRFRFAFDCICTKFTGDVSDLHLR